MLTMLNDLPVIKIKGKKGTHLFGFDTGAPISVIDKNRVGRIFGKDIKANMKDIIQSDFSLADHITLSECQFRVENLSSLNDAIIPYQMDGILSVHSLNADKVIIDKENQKIYVLWEKGRIERGQVTE